MFPRLPWKERGAQCATATQAESRASVPLCHSGLQDSLLQILRNKGGRLPHLPPAHTLSTRRRKGNILHFLQAEQPANASGACSLPVPVGRWVQAARRHQLSAVSGESRIAFSSVWLKEALCRHQPTSRAALSAESAAFGLLQPRQRASAWPGAL